MASLSDLKLKYRLFMRAYRFRSVDFGPGCRLGKPLGDSRVALVTTAAFHLPEQPAFDESIKGGDCSFREIAADVDVQELLIAHRSEAFDHSGIERDRNLALPMDRLRELAAGGRIGSIAPRHFSFAGSITAPKRLTQHTAPQVAEHLSEDGVDAVLLTPV